MMSSTPRRLDRRQHRSNDVDRHMFDDMGKVLIVLAVVVAALAFGAGFLVHLLVKI